jgi:hypothetical protein
MGTVAKTQQLMPWLYVRSNSNDPRIEENRGVIHKIGVTGNDVKGRIVSAKVDPTLLLADVNRCDLRALQR